MVQNGSIMNSKVDRVYAYTAIFSIVGIMSVYLLGVLFKTDISVNIFAYVMLLRLLYLSVKYIISDIRMNVR